MALKFEFFHLILIIYHILTLYMKFKIFSNYLILDRYVEGLTNIYNCS